MRTQLSNLKLLQTLRILYILFVFLNLIGASMAAVILYVNLNLVRVYLLQLIESIRVVYTNYIYNTHQLLNLFSMVLFIIVMFRLNKNLRNNDPSNCSNRFLIAVHFIVPIFGPIFRFTFFGKYWKSAGTQKKSNGLSFKQLRILLLIVELGRSLSVYSQIVLFFFWRSPSNMKFGVGMSLAAYVFTLLISFIGLKFIKYLKEADSIYEQNMFESQVLDSPVE